MKVNNILETIGNTPEVRINDLFRKDLNVYLKLERTNPGGSIKDRVALAMIEDAEKSKLINKDTLIVEPTSGNTGIGLAMVCAVKKYKLQLVMPESMSIERRKIMKAYGAELILTPKEQGMKGAILKAKEINEKNENSWMPQQFKNKSNPEIHKKTTAQEILKSFPEGIDFLVTSVGTGGHISGVSEILKEKCPKLKTYAVEPISSPVLSGGKAGGHSIQGIGAGFIPDVYNKDVVDNIIQVEEEESSKFVRKLAFEEGILAGISTGATLSAFSKIESEIPVNSTVLLINYDTGERYLSVDGLF
ncbi:MAG: cysteine synthase A [Tenacibaculum sp.]|nr:cysteine synthase A [Tenacibaculum sp.]